MSNDANYLYHILQHKNNGENLENQILEITSSLKTDLLILALHKEKSFWKRIFDHHASEGIVEKSHLPVIIIN